ncbi:MAG TPA: 30S ribosomal protein S6 [Clostridiales bacterium]|nr:30S ribosomal protein S6 [Clostridiales bacterium]HCG36036.1 30S ribosomal protein S6 [Clostridiales bacterium]
MNKYETIFVVSGELEETAAKAVAEKFTSLISTNGSIDQLSDWGKRRLAYPINDILDGYYTLVNFTTDSEFPKELDRIYNITDGVLRSIIVKRDE